MKTSNKFAIAATLLLAVLPAVSMIMNVYEGRAFADRIESVMMPSDSIAVVIVSGRKASPGMLSVAPRGGKYRVIELNACPGSVARSGDTLAIDFPDRSDVYQGYIRIPGLRTAIYSSGDTLRFE